MHRREHYIIFCRVYRPTTGTRVYDLRVVTVTSRFTLPLTTVDSTRFGKKKKSPTTGGETRDAINARGTYPVAAVTAIANDQSDFIVLYAVPDRLRQNPEKRDVEILET